MKPVGAELLLVIPAYLLGTLPTAVVVGRRVGHDPTREGSGNPGASNVYRVAGRRAGLTVFAVDFLKGVVAAGVGLAVGGRDLGLACGAAAVVGHVFPATRRFRGGRGVATAGGMAVVLFPVPSAVLAAAWALVAAVTRKASLASLVVAAGMPVLLVVTGRPWQEIAVVLGVAAVVVARHGGNIARLLRGEEGTLASPERPR